MANETRILVFWTPPGCTGDEAPPHPIAIGELLIRDSAPRYQFHYLRNVRRAQDRGFRPFPEFPDLERAYRSDRLFPLLANRLMPESRPDFAEYLEQHDLVKGSSDRDELLRRVDGSRATDRIALIEWPKRGRQPQTFVHFFVRGVAETVGAEEAIDALRADDPIEASDMPPDRDVIPLETPQGEALGYLPWTLHRRVVANGSSGPPFRIRVVQVNRPPAPVARRLLCRLELLRDVAWSEDFEPLAHADEPASVVREPPPR